MQPPDSDKEQEPQNQGLTRSEERKSWGESPRLGDPKKALGLSEQPGDRWDYVGRYSAALGILICVVRFLLLDSVLDFSILLPQYVLDFVSNPLVLVLGLCLFVIGIICQRHGKKLFAASLNKEILRMDESRPPVLYLRSFQSDKKASRIFLQAFMLLRRVNPQALSQLDLGLDDLETEEESLARVMNEIGPLVAIGRPGEKLPTLGAARMYVGNDEWQGRVTELLSQARLVLLRPGKTAGFWWEFEHSARPDDRHKLVLLLPFNRWRYKRFRERAQQILRSPLPDYKGLGLFSTYGSQVRAVIYFDADGTAHFRRVKRFSMKGRMDTPLVGSFKRALLPIGQRFGLKWE